MARSRRNVPVADHPIPDDWAEFIGALADDPAYKSAWAYAKSMNNSDKAAYVFADNKWQEFQDGGDYAAPGDKSPEQLQAEIDRLMAEKEKLEGSAS